ncbi:MAG: 30S ribosomal protein S2 [Nanohaloarchaea archaeon]|nr:30S ribosomal protein S2 [Candidatus Nanohaloarchaea archaeon]
MTENAKVALEQTGETKLLPASNYLSAGIHIGMKQRVKAMERYIYKVRSDKLAVFNVQLIDEQIQNVANLLTQYNPEDILVVSRKKNGHKPVVKFAEAIGGAKVIYGRFYPGTLTNPNYEKYMEPKIVIVTDPFLDKQIVSEAVDSNVPIIGLCDTFNNPKNLDVIISMNNKGKKAIALVYWLLAREILKNKGEIKGDAEFKFTLNDFEMPEFEEKEEKE